MFQDARAKAGEPKPNTEEYWQTIPSQNLYFFADKIFNMNPTYKPPEEKVADADAVRRLVIQIIGPELDPKNITITQEKVAAPTSPEPQPKPPQAQKRN